MDDNHPTNDYGAYVVSSEISMNLDEMKARLQLCLELTPETFQEKVLHLRKCKHREIDDTKRWHLCMTKELIAKARENAESYKMSFYVYRPSKKPLGKGKTYAYYIPCRGPEMKEQVKHLFDHLDGKFIRSGSYQLHNPNPRTDGSQRQYLIVSFRKNNDVYPKTFIRTLRALLDDTVLGETSLEVKWCSHSVLRDVIGGVTK